MSQEICAATPLRRLGSIAVPLAFGLAALTGCTTTISGGDADGTPNPGSGGSGPVPVAGSGGVSGSAGIAGTAGQPNPAAGGSGGVPPASGGTGGVVMGTGGSGGSVPVASPDAAGPMPLRHLTSREHRNSVAALVADTSLAEDDVPTETSDATFDGFPFRQTGMVGTVEAEALQLAGESVARNIAGTIDAILPCQPANASEEAGCARSFIEAFAKCAYRRPPTAGQLSRLDALYAEGRSVHALDFRGAIALVVEAILQSPAFYYIDPRDPGPAEVDPNGGVIKMSGYPLASRLSYFLWGAPPDDQLLTAADNGSLAEVAGVSAEAQRLASDARAHGMASDFADDLLDMDILPSRGKDADAYPNYDLELADAMRAEVSAFAAGALFGQAPTLLTFLTSPSSFVNEPLAELYGLDGVNGSDFSAVSLPPGERGGLLTLAGFLANTGSAGGSLPPRRGKFVYTRLLCAELPPPPAEVPSVGESMPGLSTRARFEAHDANPCATGCHSILDGIGFAFEHYDGIGAYRDTEQGVPVNSASAYAFDEVNAVPFADAIELGTVLAGEPLAQACFARQWLRYALHRADTVGDEASLTAITDEFRAQGGSIPALWATLATSRTFRYRAPAPDEVFQ